MVSRIRVSFVTLPMIRMLDGPSWEVALTVALWFIVWSGQLLLKVYRTISYWAG